jgi:hypothetical protein
MQSLYGNHKFSEIAYVKFLFSGVEDTKKSPFRGVPWQAVFTHHQEAQENRKPVTSSSPEDGISIQFIIVMIFILIKKKPR